MIFGIIGVIVSWIGLLGFGAWLATVEKEEDHK
jgi:hypothetical protein